MHRRVVPPLIGPRPSPSTQRTDIWPAALGSALPRPRPPAVLDDRRLEAPPAKLGLGSQRLACQGGAAVRSQCGSRLGLFSPQHPTQEALDPIVVNRDDVHGWTGFTIRHGAPLLLSWLPLATSSFSQIRGREPYSNSAKARSPPWKVTAPQTLAAH
jgi:hypothetical protein